MTMKTYKVVEWFGGIGAFTHALHKLQIPHEIVDYVEIDKFAVKSFNQMNDTNFKPQDIRDVDVSKYYDIDFLVAGWPCQDYSVAGKQVGTFEGTRSNLILTTIDKIKEMKHENRPRFIILENVKGLLNKKFENDLEFIKSKFFELGYHWEQSLLNAKYFDVPQNRERVYIVLNRHDITSPVYINELEKLNLCSKRLRSVLNFNVDKYVHNTHWDDKEDTHYFYNEMPQYNGKIIKYDKNSFDKFGPEIIKVATLGVYENEKFISHTFTQKKHFLSIDGISKCLRAGDCDAENKIMWSEIPFKQDSKFYSIDGIAPTLCAQSPDFKSKVMWKGQYMIYYRNLTPQECWALMGFTWEAFYKVSGISNSQLCKMAGNSIVVNVLQEIIKLTLKENYWV